MHDDRVYRDSRPGKDDQNDWNDRRTEGRERKPPPDVSHLISVKVDNLDYTMTTDDVRGMFEGHGEIGDVYIPRDRATGQSRGFAFVRYTSKEDAERAVQAMHESDQRGRVIRCAIAERGRGENPKVESGNGARDYSDRGGRGDRQYRDDRYDRRDDSRRDGGYDRRYEDRRSGDRYDDRRAGDRYDDRRSYDRYDDRRRPYDDRRGDGPRDSYRDDRRRDDAPRHHPYERDSRAPPSQPRDSR